MCNTSFKKNDKNIKNIKHIKNIFQPSVGVDSKIILIKVFKDGVTVEKAMLREGDVTRFFGQDGKRFGEVMLDADGNFMWQGWGMSEPEPIGDKKMVRILAHDDNADYHAFCEVPFLMSY